MSDPLDDEIDRMARAFRDETEGDAPEADRTLRALLAAPPRQRVSQAWLLAAAVLLVAFVGAPTAWAWWTGRLGVAPSSETRTGVPRAPVAAPRRVGAPPPQATTTTATTQARPLAPEPVLAPPPALEPAARTPTRRATPVVETAAPVVAEALPPVDPVERRAYEEAHALHFGAHSPAAALAAWDAYLAQYPSGRFAVEARYNRALTLVRLGRTDEAREALTPFADGAYGAYRRTEARALIDALADAP